MSCAGIAMEMAHEKLSRDQTKRAKRHTKSSVLRSVVLVGISDGVRTCVGDLVFGRRLDANKCRVFAADRIEFSSNSA